MAYVTIVAMFALVQFLYFGVAVGRARGRHGVTAPAVTGDETFECFHRAHQNTLEQMAVFIPAIMCAGYYSNPLIAAAVGLIYLAGRAYYFRCYVVEPDSRGAGMIATMLANVVLVIMALVGAVRVILQG